MKDLAWYAGGIVVVALAAWLCVRAVRRFVRRRWQRWVAAGVGGLTAEGLRLGLRWASSRSFLTAGWWLAQRDRHRMWRAVSAAGHAVAQARSAGAATGELPRLCAELRQAAAGLDHLLLAEAEGGATAGTSGSAGGTASTVRGDLRALLGAADDLREAALVALREHASPRVAALSSSVQIETEAFRAGLESARQGRAGSLV